MRCDAMRCDAMGAVGTEPELLPSFHELLHRFSLFDSSATSRCDAQIGPNGSVFCPCEGCVRWRYFVEGRDPADNQVKYEVFTREHVTGLAHYLRARAADYNLSVMDVLEVGAGDGRLSHHLNRSLSRLLNENQGPVVRVTATDSGARGLNGPAVKEEDAIHSITTRKPHVVISSWMPRGVDWTAQMRAERSVREYILIGETDNGICGCPWQTWGFVSAWNPSDSDEDGDAENNSNKQQPPQPETNILRNHRDGTESAAMTRPSESEVPALRPFALTANDWGLSEVASVSDGVAIDGKTCERSEEEAAPYERDGWVRVELDSLSRVQVCRTDERWSTSRHSRTVSFRRK